MALNSQVQTKEFNLREADIHDCITGHRAIDAEGISPALMYATRISETDLIFSAKWLNDDQAENRLEGDHFAFSITLGF